MSTQGTPSELQASLLVLTEAAARAATAGRLQQGSEERLLQLTAETAMRLFGTTATSIALFEREADRLVFRAAAGAQGPAVVGMSVGPSDGIVGYVFSTGEPVALADITSDARFDRALATKVGYIPRSVLAVPLIVDKEIVGVIELFDRDGGESFSVRDMELASAFAAQAGYAIAGTRIQHDLPALLAAALSQVAPDLSAEGVEAIVTEATGGLDRAGGSPFWALVDQVSRLRGLGDNELELVGDILDAVAEHRGHGSGSSRRALR
jgi:GAF domain-containing protein